MYVWHGKAWQGKGRRPQRNATQRLAWHGMAWAVTVVMIIWKAINRNRWTVTLLLSVQSVPVISPVIRRASKEMEVRSATGTWRYVQQQVPTNSLEDYCRETKAVHLSVQYRASVTRTRQVPARSLHPRCGCLPAALGKLHLSLPPRAGFAVPPSLPPAAALPLPFLPRRAEYCGVLRTAVTLTDHRSVTFAQRGRYLPLSAPAHHPMWVPYRFLRPTREQPKTDKHSLPSTTSRRVEASGRACRATSLAFAPFVLLWPALSLLCPAMPCHAWSTECNQSNAVADPRVHPHPHIHTIHLSTARPSFNPLGLVHSPASLIHSVAHGPRPAASFATAATEPAVNSRRLGLVWLGLAWSDSHDSHDNRDNLDNQ